MVVGEPYTLVPYAATSCLLAMPMLPWLALLQAFQVS